MTAGLAARRRAWLVLLVFSLAASYAACSTNKHKHNPDDPFDDPFFREGHWSELDNSYLSHDEREAMDDAGYKTRSDLVDPEDGEGDDEDGKNAKGPAKDKTFSEKAEEASLATMSVLVGLGMTALPFLLPGL
jgi:hypothetical protein